MAEAIPLQNRHGYDFVKMWDPVGPIGMFAVNLAPKKGEEGLTGQCFDPDQKREISAWINTHNGYKNIYFSVNRPKRKIASKLKKEDVGAVLAYHVDIDAIAGKPLDEERERCIAALRAYKIKPSVIIFSGGGAQGFWLLRNPASIKGPDDILKHEAKNRFIMRAFKGDHCWNIDRIMRMPYTWNLPNDKKLSKGRQKVLSSLIEADFNLRYDPDDFEELFEADSKAGFEAGQEAPGWPRAEIPDKIAALIKDGVDPDVSKKPYEGDRSRGVFAVASALVRAGRSDEEIAAVLTDATNGISEHILSQKSPYKYAAKQAANARFKAGPPKYTHERPIIQLSSGNMDIILDEVDEAICKLGDIYQQAGRVVEVVRAPNDHLPRIHAADRHHMLAIVSRAAKFERYNAKIEEMVIVNCPADVAAAYISRGKWRLPRLTGIITAPTMRPDFSILEIAGYDKATGLYYDPMEAEFDPVPDEVSKADAAAALLALGEPLAKYIFASPAARSVALSGILTAVVRRSLTQAPLHAYSAPVAGSGKSILVDVAAVIATGERASVYSTGQTEEEFEKRLATALIEGAPLVNIDNISRPLKSDLLCQILTQGNMSLRILGKSQSAQVATSASFYATGNNLVVYGDLNRRTLTCKLHIEAERPETRYFDFNPMDMARRNRSRYVIAALTMIRAYHLAGERLNPPPFESFEDWTKFVRCPLIWLGEADPAGVIEEARLDDPEVQTLQDILQEWDAAVGSKRVKTSELINFSVDHAGLRNALIAVANNGKVGPINDIRLGRWLTAHMDRQLDGYVIHRKFIHKQSYWTLQAPDDRADAEEALSGIADM